MADFPTNPITPPQTPANYSMGPLGNMAPSQSPGGYGFKPRNINEPAFGGTQLPSLYQGKGFTGPTSAFPYMSPGAQQASAAGVEQRMVNTGLPKEVEAGFILANRMIGQQQPNLDYIQGLYNQMGNVAQGSLPQMQGWMQNQANLGGQLQQQGYGGLAPAQAAQLQALQGLGGLAGQSYTGQLSPEMQGMIDQQRQLAIERSNQASQQGLDQNLSRLQALMEGRGLGSSSVASRGQADIMNQVMNQQEQGRLAAEQGALQQEQMLRQLGLQQMGVQGGLLGQAGQLGGGLTEQGLGILGAGTGLQQAYGMPAQTMMNMDILSKLAAQQQGFTQQNIANQLQAVGLGAGMPVQPTGGGFGEILGGTAGALGGLASGVGGLAKGFNWGGA